MSGCNATLTTLVHTDETMANTIEVKPPRGYIHVGFRSRDIPEGATVTRRDDSLYRDEVVVLTCKNEHVPGDLYRSHYAQFGGEARAVWNDDTPGATPHVDPEPPLVSDEERTAAREEFAAAMSSKRPNGVEVVALDKALEAAARVRNGGDA